MRFSVSPRSAATCLLAIGLGSVGLPRAARAGRNDLNLLNLCERRPPMAGFLQGPVAECGWVRRASAGAAGGSTITGVAVPSTAESQFRSLMSEVGVMLAPRMLVPAATLGFSGFEFAGELGLTQISSGAAYWNGVDGVSVQNPGVWRPNAWQTTVGAFVRKGIWLGLPAFELGAGFVNVLDSRLIAWQGYAKVALHEGYTRLPVPSVAVRSGISYLTGTDQVRMTVTSIDFIASKGFGVGGTFRFEPFIAWSLLSIRAQSGVIDATPSCDAYQPGGDYCSDPQRGPVNDRAAYFRFEDQDAIGRQRYSGGAKIKFASVFLTAQYDVYPAGGSRDGRKNNGAHDDSARQTAFALSGGFDF